MSNNIIVSIPVLLGRSGGPNSIGTNILGHRTAKQPSTIVPINIVFPVDSPSVAISFAYHEKTNR